MEHDARCEYYSVRAFAQRDSLANGQLAPVLIDFRDLLAAHANILDARPMDALSEHALQAGRVGYVEHGAARQYVVQRDVLEGHMRATVHGRGHAGIGADHRNVVLCIAAGQEYLVKAAAGRERAERMDDGSKARHCKSCCYARHVCFGYAAVNGAIRVPLGPFERSGAPHQIRIQKDGIGIVRHDLLNGRAKHVLAETRVHFTGIHDFHSHSSNAVSSACNVSIHRAYRSSLTGIL